MAQPKAVLFDLDETLFDHRHSADAALGALQKLWPRLATIAVTELQVRHRRILDETHPRVLAGTLTKEDSRVLRMRLLLETAGISPSDSELQVSLGVIGPAYAASRRPIPGALAVLESLRRRGIRIGVVTNNHVDEQVDKLRACGLKTLVDALAISQETGFIKPDPRMFLVALSRVGVRAEEAVMVGDSWEADILGALASGIRPVWFNRASLSRLHPGVQELRSFEPTDAAFQVIVGEPFVL